MRINRPRSLAISATLFLNMPYYSSDQFYQDWHYAIDEDFVTPNGEAFPYADDGKQEWGDEIKKLTFKGAPQDACISNDGKRLAVAVNHDIHILDTETWATIAVLKGHISRVDAIAFKPTDANVLVSSEQHDYAHSGPAGPPTIIVWKTDQVRDTRALEEEALKSASAVAAAITAASLTKLGVELTREGLAELEEAYTPAITRVVTKHTVTDNIRIHGRLKTSFQSEVFSPTGKWMVYLPGDRPRSNGNAVWDVKVCSADDFKDHVTLKGHTDAIMWTGWNRHESLIATVSWDKTIRIWEAATGQQTFKFVTDGQNWTGAFSPDSTYFAATSGKGSLQIYSLRDGSIHWVYKGEGPSRWRRAVDWHPNGTWLAAGGQERGQLLLLDIEKKQILQQRLLSTKRARPDEEDARRMIGTILEVNEVKFVDGGHKLATWTTGDCSIEIYDITQQLKWRFARGGTDDGPKSHDWIDEKGKVASKGGHCMLAWENEQKDGLMLASVDFDGVRIWSSLRLTNDSKTV
jgi:WD40 repeat protein